MPVPWNDRIGIRKRTVSTPSRMTARNASATSASRAALGERSVDAVLELALERAALAAHPEEHPREHADGEDAGEALEGLLDDERQPLDREGDHQPDRDRQADRGNDADRDLAERVAPADLHEVGGDDADDERGLEAFAKHQEERGEHRRAGPRDSRCLALCGQARLSREC